MLILRQVVGYQAGKKASSTSASPLLKKQLEDTQKDLNQILNKWKFGDAPIRTSEEFLANFEPWINKQLEQQKEWKVFLAKHGLHNLGEVKNVNLPESESDQLKFYKDNIQIKEQIIEDYKNQEQTWQNTEADYLARIEELKTSRETSEEVENLRQELAQQAQTFANTEQDYLTQIADQDQELKDKVKEFQASNGELLKRIEELKANRELPEDYEDLITERDEAIREKKTLEQDLLATNNRLNLKQQEVSNKDKALEKLKREKNQLEVQQQKALKEKNGLITTLNQEIKQHKDKYSKQGKLLDTEQLECKKLEEENEKLKAEIQQLKGGSH